MESQINIQFESKPKKKVQIRNPIETAQAHTSNLNPTDKVTSKMMG